MVRDYRKRSSGNPFQGDSWLEKWKRGWAVCRERYGERAEKSRIAVT